MLRSRELIFLCLRLCAVPPMSPIALQHGHPNRNVQYRFFLCDGKVSVQSLRSVRLSYVPLSISVFLLLCCSCSCHLHAESARRHTAVSTAHYSPLYITSRPPPMLFLLRSGAPSYRQSVMSASFAALMESDSTDYLCTDTCHAFSHRDGGCHTVETSDARETHT